MKKTFEVLPVGAVLQDGDLNVYHSKNHGATVRTEGRFFRPVNKKKRETITHEPDTPSDITLRALTADCWADEAHYIEWAKLEIARLREERGESSAPKKRETITHDGVEYDAEQVDGPYTGQLVATESFVVGKLGALGVTYHAPVTVEPEEPSADYINNSYISRYIEWAKEEIARLREDLGESP